MQPTLRVNQSLMNLACVSSLNTSICGKQEVHQLIRRKLSGNAYLDKRKKSSFQMDQVAVRYIPIIKACQDTSASANVSRQNSKENLHDGKRNSMSTRRFQRISQSSYENLKTVQCNMPKEACKTKVCIDEKAQMAEAIKHLKGKNERLQEEKLKLEAQVKEYQERIKNVQEQMKQKCQKNEELSGIMAKKEVACNKMHETINEKYRQISKLEDIVSKLQKQIMSSNNPQSFTPLSLESSRIINQLSSQLKYKEIENHLLKKERFDAFALEEQLRVMTKENTLLKDRLSYYIRMNGKNALDDSCSSQSISLELSETSPLRRSSRDQFSNHILKASQP